MQQLIAPHAAAGQSRFRPHAKQRRKGIALIQILYSPTSPYSAKVRMAAKHAGLEFESVMVNTSVAPENLISANPLGKIPVLITAEGQSVFDSRCITQYINRVTGSKLFPRQSEKRLDAEKLEALADGLCDVLITQIYERRFRPEEKVHVPWLEKQWEKTERVLAMLDETPPRIGKRIHGGHIALAAAMSYLALRFEGRWEKKYPKLKRWQKRFNDLHPDLAEFLPRAV